MPIGEQDMDKKGRLRTQPSPSSIKKEAEKATKRAEEKKKREAASRPKPLSSFSGLPDMPPEPTTEEIPLTPRVEQPATLEAVVPAEILDGEGAKDLRDSMRRFKLKSGDGLLIGTDKGVGYKDKNEDRAVIVPTENFVAIVDGMGGVIGGEISARMLAEKLKASPLQVIEATKTAKGEMDAYGVGGGGAVFISARLRPDSADKKILEVHQAGDAKLIVIKRDGSIRFESKDESAIQALIDGGTVSPEEASCNEKYKNLRAEVTNYVGPGQNKEPTSYEVAVEAGDRVLLYSDGISDNLTPGEIAEKAKGMTADQLFAWLSDTTGERMKGKNNIIATSKDRAKAGVFSDGYKSRPKTDNRALAIWEIGGEVVEKPAEQKLKEPEKTAPLAEVGETVKISLPGRPVELMDGTTGIFNPASGTMIGRKDSQGHELPILENLKLEDVLQAGKAEKPAPKPAPTPTKQREVVKIDLPPNPMRTEKAPEAASAPEQRAEIKTFSKAFMEKKIQSLLSSQEGIKTVKSVSIEGNGNEITLKIRVEAEKFFVKADIYIKAVLVNRRGSIKVTNCDINADTMKSKIDKMIRPELEKVPQLLKTFIEKEENKEVEKIEIKNGELVVTFKKSESVSAPAPEPTPVVGTGEKVKEGEESEKEKATAQLRAVILKEKQIIEEAQRELKEIQKRITRTPEENESKIRERRELEHELLRLDIDLTGTIPLWHWNKRKELKRQRKEILEALEQVREKSN